LEALLYSQFVHFHQKIIFPLHTIIPDNGSNSGVYRMPPRTCSKTNTCNVVNSCYIPFTCNTVSRTYERKRAAFPNNFPKPARKPQHLHQQKLQASSHDIDRGSLARLSALFRCTKIGRMASGKVTIWLYPADCCDETKRLSEKLWQKPAWKKSRCAANGIAVTSPLPFSFCFKTGLKWRHHRRLPQQSPCQSTATFRT
jgi:hypothetical protein